MDEIPTGIDPKAIGARIILIRNALNDMTAADFARMVGLSTQALANYEVGDRRPNLDQALKIVQKTGVTLDYIYLGDVAGLPHRLTRNMPISDATPKRIAG